MEGRSHLVQEAASQRHGDPFTQSFRRQREAALRSAHVRPRVKRESTTATWNKHAGRWKGPALPTRSSAEDFTDASIHQRDSLKARARARLLSFESVKSRERRADGGILRQADQEKDEQKQRAPQASRSAARADLKKAEQHVIASCLPRQRRAARSSSEEHTRGYSAVRHKNASGRTEGEAVQGRVLCDSRRKASGAAAVDVGDRRTRRRGQCSCPCCVCVEGYGGDAAGGRSASIGGVHVPSRRPWRRTWDPPGASAATLVPGRRHAAAAAPSAARVSSAFID